MGGACRAAIDAENAAEGWNPMADKSPKDTSLQSTKQMLDELDALMEKMLSLPVNDLDEAPAGPVDTSKGPTLAASLTLLEPNAPQPEPAAKKEPPAAKASSPTVAAVAAPAKKLLDRRPKPKAAPHPPVKPPHLTKLPTPASPPRPRPAPKLEPEVHEPTLPFSFPEPEPLTNEVLPPTVLPSLEPLLTHDPEEVAGGSSSGWSFSPLLWINQNFDHATAYLGTFGQRLRSYSGRNVLGISGIALLLVAVGWVLMDWMGWNWQ